MNDRPQISGTLLNPAENLCPSAKSADDHLKQLQRLSEIQQSIQPHLVWIEKLLPPEYRLTLVCRYAGTEFQDADIVLTFDELPKVAGVIARFSEKTP